MEALVATRLSYKSWKYFLETHVKREQQRYDYDEFEELVNGLKLGRACSYFDAIKKGLRKNYTFYLQMLERAKESRVWSVFLACEQARSDKDVRRCLAACYILANLLNVPGPDTLLFDDEERKIELRLVSRNILDYLQHYRFVESNYEVNNEADFFELTEDGALLEGL